MIQLNDAEIEKIDDWMLEHVQDHHISNSPYGHVCEAYCRKNALKRGVNRVLEDRQPVITNHPNTERLIVRTPDEDLRALRAEYDAATRPLPTEVGDALIEAERDVIFEVASERSNRALAYNVIVAVERILADRLAAAPVVHLEESIDGPTLCRVTVRGVTVFAGQDHMATPLTKKNVIEECEHGTPMRYALNCDECIAGTPATKVPPPFRPDPELIDNSEGNEKIKAADRAAAERYNNIMADALEAFKKYGVDPIELTNEEWATFPAQAPGWATPTHEQRDWINRILADRATRKIEE